MEGFKADHLQHVTTLTEVAREIGIAASTQVAEDAPAGSYHDRTLKQRLDDSALSKHPHDPDPVKQGTGS